MQKGRSVALVIFSAAVTVSFAQVHTLRKGEEMGPGKSLKAETPPGYMEAIRKIESDAAVSVKAARKLADAGLMDRAVAQYQRASAIVLAVDEGSSDELRAESLLIQGRYADAAAVYRELIARNRLGAGMNGYAGVALVEVRDYSTAWRVMSSYLSVPHPVGAALGNDDIPTSKGVTDKNVTATAYLMAAWQAGGYYGQRRIALRYLAKADLLAPKNAAICYLIGKFKMASKEFAEAIPYLETALETRRPSSSKAIEEMLSQCRWMVKEAPRKERG